MNSARSRHILGKMILVIISIIISFVMAELLIRKALPPDTGTSVEHRIPHPIFGWTLEPNANYSNRMPEDTVRVTYNSEGFRDVDHNFENPLNTFRILVLGDSFMEAYNVELSDAFHKQIEQFVREEGFEIEVINQGVGGYGTLQEYLVYRDIGKLYNPNLVLLGFTMGNDLINNSLELESLLRADSMYVESRPFLDVSDPTNWAITVVDYEGALRRYTENKERHNSFLRKLVRQSVLLETLRTVGYNVRNNIQNKLTTREARESQIKRQTTYQEHLYFTSVGMNYCQEPPEFTESWDITKRILARIKGDVENSGGTLVVFALPLIHEVDENEMEAVKKNAPNSETDCLEEAPGYERLKNILNELDIEYVNLLPNFRDVNQDGNSNLYRLSDRHWNEEGHALAAKVVGSYLLQKNLITSSNAAKPNDIDNITSNK